eukprot:scaffold1695_cov132-Pinguiococcus_pyrenoidosus.AAC.2
MDRRVDSRKTHSSANHGSSVQSSRETLAESIQARFKGKKSLPELLWRANHAASLSAEAARSATAAMLWRANDAASLSTEHGTATGAAAESAEPRGPRFCPAAVARAVPQAIKEDVGWDVRQ